MRRLFLVALFVLLFPVSIASSPEREETIIRNDPLGFTLTLNGDWRFRIEEPMIVDGQEIHAAYWKDDTLQDSFPYILVRSVDTGKVNHSDITGLNKIAIQSTLDGISSDRKPLLAVQNYYPHKSLFSYSVEVGNAQEKRVLVNKYVYYTEKGMLEFSMYCDARDTESMVTINIALKNAELDFGTAYELTPPGHASATGGMGMTGMIAVCVTLLFLVAGGIRSLWVRI